MNIQDQIKQARNLMEIEIKVTKELYKAFDSYNRKQKWILSELVKYSKEKYGLDETE